MIKIAATSKLALYDVIVEEQSSTEEHGQTKLVLHKGDFKTIAKMLEDHEIVSGLLISEHGYSSTVSDRTQTQRPLIDILYSPSKTKPNGAVIPESIDFGFLSPVGELVDITLSADNVLSFSEPHNMH